MEINRNQYFLAGLVLLFLGLQIFRIDSVVLTPECAKFLALDGDSQAVAASDSMSGVIRAETGSGSKKFQPPEWISWALMCAGAVLILHSWAMPRPS
jgi:hypothetical protein